MKKEKLKSRFIQEEKKKTPMLVRLILLVMVLMIGALGYKINEKIHFMDHPFITKMLNTGTWIPYENWFSYYDNTVSSTLIYHRLSDNYFVNGTNQCASLADGVVLSAENSQVLILQDNGILVTYGNLNEILVKSDERILRGSVVATFQESVTLDFELNGEKMDYESAIATS